MTRKDFWKWSPEDEGEFRAKLSAIGLDLDELKSVLVISDEDLLKRTEAHWDELSSHEQELILQLAGKST